MPSPIVEVDFYIPLEEEAEKIGLRREDGSLTEVYLGDNPNAPFISNEIDGPGTFVLEANYDFIVVTLNGGDVEFTSFDSSSNGCVFTLIIKQDEVGGRIITLPSDIKWPGGVAPTFTTDPEAVDVLTFLTIDMGTVWYGFLAGLNMLVSA